jgi:hypothetical protein
MQKHRQHDEEQRHHGIPVERHVEGQAGAGAIAPGHGDHRRAAEEDRQHRQGDDAQEAAQGRMHEPHPGRRLEHLLRRRPQAHQHEEHAADPGDDGKQMDGFQRGIEHG